MRSISQLAFRFKKILFSATVLLCLLAISLFAIKYQTQNNNCMYDACEGVNAYNLHHYAEAFPWFQKVATEDHDPRAMSYLGYMYLNGLGVPRNYQQAMYWYQKAAALGNTGVMNNIGNLYHYGEGIPQNYKEAMLWYKKAALHGDTYGMNGIGSLYENGQGVTRDYQQAMKWYQKAAAQGNAYAMDNIGFFYEDGKGVAQNYQQAMQWYQKQRLRGMFSQ